MTATRYTLGNQAQRVTEAVVQDEIFTLYVICDEYLKAIGYRADAQGSELQQPR